MSNDELNLYEELNLKGHLNDDGKDYYIGLLKRDNMDEDEIKKGLQKGYGGVQ